VLDPTAAGDSGAQFSVVVSNAAGSVTSPAATLTVMPGGTVVLVEAHFDSGADGFVYADDLFRGTSRPEYETGAALPAGGFTGGGLQVVNGGVNGQNIPNMSGGWWRSFTLDAAGPTKVSFRYKLSMVRSRTDRFGQVLVSVNGVLAGVSPNDYVVQLAGTGGGGTSTTGWQTVEVDLGQLPAGTHTLSLGGYLTRKSNVDEFSEVLIDDVVVTVAQ
jgi:hypothetical protein